VRRFTMTMSVTAMYAMEEMATYRSSSPRSGDWLADRNRCEVQHLVAKADEVQTLKYRTQRGWMPTAKLRPMPKPLYGETTVRCMHVQSSVKDGKNTFAGEGYAGLSDIALYFIGGIIKHGKALNGFTQPKTNLYKRVRPRF
jgi:glutamine synthetase